MLNSIAKALDKAKSERALGAGGSKPAPGTAEALTTFTTVSDTRQLHKLHLLGQDIEGLSVAGFETSIALPRCKVALDIGRCPQRSVFQQTLLITHGHLDHVGGIPFHVASRRMLGLPPSRIVVHPHYVEPLTRFLEASNALEGSDPAPYELVPLAEGQELQLPSGYIVRPFNTVHTIPSQGYILYSVRKKLKAELQGRSQDDIKQLRLSGQEVTDTFQCPEVAFTGDTSAGLFASQGAIYDDVFKAKLLIMELTFVNDDVTVAHAREKGHMHIAELVANAHKLQNEAVLLIHFSGRYGRDFIRQALDENMPPALRAKCVPLLNGFD